VHFRDTAHGFLAWAVATLVGIVLAATVLAPPTGPTMAAVVSAATFQNDVPASAVGDMASANAPIDPAALRARVERDANMVAQVSFFMAIGLLLGAFTACVAAAIGGLRREEMRVKFWTEHARVARPLGP